MPKKKTGARKKAEKQRERQKHIRTANQERSVAEKPCNFAMVSMNSHTTVTLNTRMTSPLPLALYLSVQIYWCLVQLYKCSRVYGFPKSHSFLHGFWKIIRFSAELALVELNWIEFGIHNSGKSRGGRYSENWFTMSDSIFENDQADNLLPGFTPSARKAEG